MSLNFKKVTVITGHYGCGKTNLAVNLALFFAKQGEPVTVIDLDIVNPYYRTNDFKDLFDEYGIHTLAPNFASTNLDVPSLPGSIQGLLRTGNGGRIIMDVGGDDAGAVALGQYRRLIMSQDYEMLYLFNPYRLLTATPEEAAAVMREVEYASRMRVTGLVNTANLGPCTTKETVAESLLYGEKLSELTGLPVRFLACAPENIPDTTKLDCFPVEVYVNAAKTEQEG